MTAVEIKYVSDVSAQLIKTNASDDDVCHAAWVSTASDHLDREADDGKKQGLINFLYRNRHMSPFEHGSFTFLIDCPIFVAREFHRHRTWSYNEVSGRYKELEPRFYLPSTARPVVQKGKIGNYTFEMDKPLMDTVRAVHKNSFREAWTSYQFLLANDVAKEVARNVLPVAIMTQFYATANPRNVMQFLDLRNDGPALYEIRQVAIQMEEAFAKAMPMTYNAYKAYDWRVK